MTQPGELDTQIAEAQPAGDDLGSGDNPDLRPGGCLNLGLVGIAVGAQMQPLVVHIHKERAVGQFVQPGDLALRPPAMNTCSTPRGLWSSP